MHSQIVPVPARRHPFQVLIALILAVSGIQILAGGPRPGSVSTLLPTPLVVVWAVVLAAGGLLVVSAAVVGPLLALYLEWIADLPLAVMCLVYAGAVWTVAGMRGAVPAALVLAVAVAAAIRFGQVTRSLRQVRAHMKAQREVGDDEGG